MHNFAVFRDDLIATNGWMCDAVRIDCIAVSCVLFTLDFIYAERRFLAFIIIFFLSFNFESRLILLLVALLQRN